jgi:hypothetical protein
LTRVPEGITANSIAGSPIRPSGSPQGEHMSEKNIKLVLRERTREWMAIPGVVGTAIGRSEGKPCIMVFASSDPEKLRAIIPTTVEGHAVVIEKTGAFRAL